MKTKKLLKLIKKHCKSICEGECDVCPFCRKGKYGLTCIIEDIPRYWDVDAISKAVGKIRRDKQ